MATDIFLSHDWGDDAAKSNHFKVCKINKALKQLGFITWFDNERMTGHILEKMAVGIEDTKCFLAFITKRYHNKVVHGDKMDMCKLEFNYACQRVPVVCVVLDPTMKDTREWKGTIGMNSAAKLYVDMSGDIDDEKYLSQQLENLAKELSAIDVGPSKTLKETIYSTEDKEMKGDLEEEKIYQVRKDVPEEQTDSGFKAEMTMSDLEEQAERLILNEEYDKALPLCKDLLKIHTSSLGATDPRTVASMASLADCFRYKKECDKAIPLYKKVVYHRTSSLEGPDKKKVDSMNCLAECFRIKKAYDKAIPLYKDVIKLRTSSFGEADLRTLASMVFLDECLRLADEQKADQKTIASNEDLAYSFFLKKEYDKAVLLYEEVVKRRTSNLGVDDLKTVASTACLKKCLQLRKDCNKASQLHEKVLKLSTSSGEVTGPKIVQSELKSQ